MSASETQSAPAAQTEETQTNPTQQTEAQQPSSAAQGAVLLVALRPCPFANPTLRRFQL
eukprot:m.113008 g.113008  ORF g.113008 m.113008 type:complete len:59 (+) comp51855_c0_seq1:90-266(+)